MSDPETTHGLPVVWPLPGQAPGDFHILVVDDQDIVRVAVRRMLQRQGFQILEASSALAALDVIQTQPVELVLLDVMMPGMNGLELVKRLDGRIPETSVLMVSGMDSLDMAMECLSHGAFAYVMKPVETNAILVAVASALRRRMLELEYRDREQILAQKVREQTLEIRESREEIAFRLISASEHRDNETGAHVRRIGLYAAAMARLLGWNESRIDQIQSAAPMHDIGKIGVPDRILQKHGPLSEEEWLIMRTHTTMGANILRASQVPFIQMGARIAACHHEKWDGSGYPIGLSGDLIPLEARMTGLVDVYDALSCRRVYKRAWTEQEVFDYILEQRGRHFDPSLVDLFAQHYETFRTILHANPDTFAPEEIG